MIFLQKFADVIRTIYYDLKGDEDSPYLLLISGLTNNHTIWSDMVAELANYFRVILMDNRGAGQSSQDQASFTIDDMANDCKQLFDYLDVGLACVVGHSMGGMIAQAFCAQYPESVLWLMLVSTAAKPPEHAIWQILERINVKRQLDVDSVLNLSFPWLYGNHVLADKDKVEQEKERAKHDPYPQTLQGYQAQANAIAQFDARDQLDKIKKPTLVLAGEDDLLIPAKVSKEQLADQLSKAKFDTLSNCGHMLAREKPAAFAKRITDFHFLEWLSMK